ncbi:hydroxylase [Streptomyces sp. NPDC006645]|uniref:NAD(P)/FAD-dependent oxidoreductase n=1 Tax=unclassified Streptomyces TaxID=2593676 RepID=UPI0033A7D4EA
MADAASVFDGLVAARPPVDTHIAFDTACVLGGSVAGLMAARVLSDHARQVVIVERDELPFASVPRPGTPQDQYLHSLLPACLIWLDGWLPGFSDEARGLGAVSGEGFVSVDGLLKPPLKNTSALLLGTRPFLEGRIRARVLALPNVTVLRGLARGIRCEQGAVTGVTYAEGQGAGTVRTLAADFVVDAMGRPSRMAEWVSAEGFDKPPLERLVLPINYSAARFARDERSEDLDLAIGLSVYTPQHVVDGVSAAAVNAVEDDQWQVLLGGYGEDRPGSTLDAFRATAAKLHPLYGRATSGAVTRDVMTFRHSDSRRRDFTGLSDYPARLVSTGDAVASFNPIYGQGMSAAALHASALSAYLLSGPDPSAAATDFFELQKVVTDAVWTTSAGPDAARLDAINQATVSEEVRRARWVGEQIQRASMVDADIDIETRRVAYLLKHPSTLADPELLERAMAVNADAASPPGPGVAGG